MTASLALPVLLVVHGAIHLLGVARAFELAPVPLARAMAPAEGLAWGAAALLFAAAAGACVLAPRWWWAPALAGVVVSQALIVGAWSDARWGTLANLIVLAAALVAAADHRPGSLVSRTRAEVERVGAEAAAEPVGPALTEADLAGLPGPVAHWLRRIGAVGRPPPRSLHVAFRIRIRGGPDEPWMEGRGEQVTRISPPERVFFMTARKAGVPVHVLHRYVDGAATMEGRLLGLVPLFERGGDEMTRSETVTLLNDLFFLAPAALPAAGIDWQEVDEHRVRATWSHAGHTVSGVAIFDAAGDLVDWVSEDRAQMDRDPPERARWRTPFSAWTTFEGVRLPRAGQAWWGRGEAAWPYVELEVERVRYDPDPPP